MGILRKIFNEDEKSSNRTGQEQAFKDKIKSKYYIKNEYLVPVKKHFKFIGNTMMKIVKDIESRTAL